MTKSKPVEWPRLRIADTLTLVNGRAFKPSEWAQSGTPIVRIQNLNNHNATFNYYRGELPDKFALQHGDLLFAWSGTPGTSFGAHVWRGGRAWLNQHIFKVLFDETLFDRRFLQVAINQNLADYVRAAHGGAGLAHITKRRFEESILPCPPVSEQKRIVAEIEKQFTRLDAAITSLKRLQANLKGYAASVLAAACEGRLVPREAEMPFSHRQSRSRLQYPKRETLPSEVPQTLRVPRHWTWSTLEDIAEIKGGITKDQKRKHSGPARSVPYLRVANVQRGYLDLTDMKSIMASESEIRALALKPGDVLFNEGGDRDKLGRGWVWNGEIEECIHQNHVFRARLRQGVMNPKFLSWYANTVGQAFFFNEGKHTTNLASISMTKLKRLPVPLPPLAEQDRIVAEVERRLSVVDELDHVVEANLRRAKNLRQAILHRAFSGNLEQR